MQRGIWILVGLALLGLVAWWLDVGGEAPPLPPQDAGAEQTGRAPETVGLRNPGLEPTGRAVPVPFAPPPAPGDAGLESALPGVRVRGRIRMEDPSKPLPPVEVYVLPGDADNRDQGFTPVQTRPDAEGRFEIHVEDLAHAWIVVRPLADGEVNSAYRAGADVDPVIVVPALRGSAVLMATIAGADVEPAHSLDVVLHPAPRRTFRVVDPRGDPVPGAKLRIGSRSGANHVPWPGPGDATMEPWHCDLQDGTCTVSISEEGPLWVRATASGYGPTQRVVPPGTGDVVLVLGPSAVVDVRLENARPGEHVSVSARAFMLESATAFFAATGETTTPGSVRLEGNLGVGRYRLYASSPDRHQRATRDIVITRPGQYLEVVLALDSQERLGELRIALPRGASRDRVALLRRCTAPDRTPWALQQVVARKGAVRLQGLRAGTYDVVLLRDGTSGACVQGLEILAQATTPWEPTWVPAMRARMPRLGDLDSPVARAHLAWRGAPALPLYVAQPGFLRTWKADVPPAAGTLLGPFPADRVDLVLELEDGSETRRTLVTRGR